MEELKQHLSFTAGITAILSQLATLFVCINDTKYHNPHDIAVEKK